MIINSNGVNKERTDDEIKSIVEELTGYGKNETITSSKSWISPKTGKAIVLLVAGGYGGGGGGPTCAYYSSGGYGGNGGASGVTVLKEVFLMQGVTYNFEIGAGGQGNKCIGGNVSSKGSTSGSSTVKGGDTSLLRSEKMIASTSESETSGMSQGGNGGYPHSQYTDTCNPGESGASSNLEMDGRSLLDIIFSRLGMGTIYSGGSGGSATKPTAGRGSGGGGGGGASLFGSGGKGSDNNPNDAEDYNGKSPSSTAYGAGGGGGAGGYYNSSKSYDGGDGGNGAQGVAIIFY